ncbi:MAG: hypothetical protein R3E13_08335 [Alphaproteobacteria bacterium]
MSDTEQQRRANLYHALNIFIGQSCALPPSAENVRNVHTELNALLEQARGIVDPDAMHKNGNWLGPDFTQSLSNRYASVANPVQHMVQTARYTVNRIRNQRPRNTAPLMEIKRSV